MNINCFNVENNNIASILNEQTFWIGKSADVEVMVNLYEHNGNYKMTSWLNKIEELNTIDYNDSINDENKILAAMEKLINDNEEYILDIASYNNEECYIEH